jgi:tRNA pseudouridine55 synthase
MAARRTDGPRIDGILVIAKPAGPTSHDVVALVRRLTGVRRVGHGGTLDPFAMGVLPVFLGHATRMVEYHLGDAKAYRAAVVFGARSTTDDIDGQMTPSQGPPPARESVEAALAVFRGPIDQVPPVHSAVHVAGRRAYQLAREGERPELAPRRVTIHGLDLVSWDTADPARPMAVLEVRCSAGTYVRSLARDLGERLGCGAYLGALTRTASGPFSLETAHPLDHVREELAAGRLEPLLLTIDAGLEAIPVVSITSRDREAIARGQVVRLHAPLAGGPVAVGRTDAADGLEASAPGAAAAPDQGLLVRVIDEAGRLAAMAHVRAGRLYPDKVFVTSEP